MRPIESKFKIYEEPLDQRGYFNKLVDERAFFEAYPTAIDYEMLEPTRRQIASWSKGNIIGRDGTIMNVFEQNSRITSTNKRYLRWRLYTNEGDLRATYIKSLEPAGKKSGIGGSIFEIVLDSEWFGPNDILIFEGFREIPIIVTSEPVPHAHGFRYEVVLSDTKPNAYFPLELIEPGTRVIQAGSPISEAAVRRGNIHYGSSDSFIEFEVPMTHMGWSMKVTDYAFFASKNYRLNINPNMDPVAKDNMKRDFAQTGIKLDSDPTKTGILFNSLEDKFMRAVNHQKDLWLTYGRGAGRFASKFLDGMTERPISLGPGLMEFMESSRVVDVNPEQNVIKLLQNRIPASWNDKVAIEDRVIDVYTGSGGLINLQRDARALDIEPVLQTSEWNYGEMEGFFEGRKGTILNKKQYRAIYLEPFGLIRFHYLPFLDSELIETRKYKGLPIRSYDHIIFNFGYGDVRNANIHIANNPDHEVWGYSIGLLSPLGKVLGKPGLSSRFYNGLNNENAFEYIHECMLGFAIKDVGNMMWLRTVAG